MFAPELLAAMASGCCHPHDEAFDEYRHRCFVCISSARHNQLWCSPFAAPLVGRLSPATSRWCLVGQRHHHERENLIGVRSTLISNEWDKLGRGADDFWYPSMRMPPFPTCPIH